MSTAKKMTFASNVAQMRIFAIFDAIDSAQDGMTYREIAPVIGLVPNAAVRYLNHLHALGMIYIAAWRSTGENNAGYCLAAFRLSDGSTQDAPKPRGLTRKQLTRRYRQRLKADPVRHMDRIMRNRAWRARNRQAPNVVDPLVAWIPRRASNDAEKEAA